MTDRIRVRLKSDKKNRCLAWATPAPDGVGFFLDWDDGWTMPDDVDPRWFFSGAGFFDIEEVQ